MGSQTLLSDSSAQVLGALHDALAPVGQLAEWDWIEANVELPHSVRSKRVRRDNARWIIKPTELAFRRTFREMTVQGAVQGSKSTIGELVIQGLPTFWPGLAFLTYQTDPAASNTAEERIFPMVQGSPATRNLLADRRYAVREGAISFHGMKLRIQGATPNNLQSASVLTLINEEVWKWENIGLIEQVRKRMTAVTHGGLLLNLSQGSIEGDAQDVAYHEGHMDEYQWECPECRKAGRNGRQPYIMRPPLDSEGNQGAGGIKYDHSLKRDDGQYDKQAVAASVYMECAVEGCGARYANTLKNRRMLSDTGEYIQTNPHPMPKVYSCRWHALAVYWIDWAELLFEWFKAVDVYRKTGNNELIKLFCQQREALAFSDKPEGGEIKIRGSGYRKADYASGELVENELRRIAAIDVQLGHFWMVVVACLANGRFRVLWEGKVEGWARLGAMADMYAVAPTNVIVDARYNTPDVLVECANRAQGPAKLRDGRWGIWGWFPFQGQDVVGARFPHRVVEGRQYVRVWLPWSEMEATKTRDGRPIPICRFAPDPNKRTLQHLLKTGMIEHPDDASKDYHDHMNDEVEVRDINKKTGKESWTFRSRDVNNPNNHLWDCMVMVVVRACQLGFIQVPALSDQDVKGKSDE